MLLRYHIIEESRNLNCMTVIPCIEKAVKWHFNTCMVVWFVSNFSLCIGSKSYTDWRCQPLNRKAGRFRRSRDFQTTRTASGLWSAWMVRRCCSYTNTVESSSENTWLYYRINKYITALQTKWKLCWRFIFQICHSYLGKCCLLSKLNYKYRQSWNVYFWFTWAYTF